jgi:hypothetical protein
VPVHQTTQRHIPEDYDLFIYGPGNNKYHCAKFSYLLYEKWELILYENKGFNIFGDGMLAANKEI